MKTRNVSACVLAIFAVIASFGAHAANFTGIRIEDPGRNEVVALDLEGLKALGWETLTTVTPWDQEPIVFGGVPLGKVLHHGGIRSDVVQAIALNDYRAEFDVAEAIAWEAFLACEIDGQPMSVRQKGPCWIVFPWSRRPELANGDAMAISVWQLHVLRSQ